MMNNSPRVSQQRALSDAIHNGPGIVQRKIRIGKDGAAKAMTLKQVLAELWAHNFVAGSRERAELDRLDADNATFRDGIPELIGHLRATTDGPTEPDLTPTDSPLPAMAAASAVGRRAEPTAAWNNYMSRMLIDLIDSDEGIDADDDSMQRVVSAVLLNHSHLASSLALTPLLGMGDHRQLSPLDREDPGVYYRSQDKGHPQVSLYKRAMTRLGKKKSAILAPHNPLAYGPLGLGSGTGSKAQKGISTRVEDGVTLRQGKHSEILSAHIGLRKSNAAAMATMVRSLAANKPGGEELVGFLAEIAREHGMLAPDAGDTPPVDEDMLDVVMDQLLGLNARLGELSVPPGLPQDATTPSSSPLALDALERATDPMLSTSHVLRKLGSALTRGHRMIGALPRLAQLRVASQAGSPQITVMVPRPHQAMTDKDYWTFTDSLRIYFGARVTLRAAQNGLPLGIDQRQSFGFIDSSVTDTAASFRISLGNEPPEFQQIINAALVDLDNEIGTLFAAHPGDQARSAVMGIGEDASRPLQTVQAPDARHIAYLKTTIASANGAFSLADFLGYATSATNLPDPHGVTAGTGVTARRGIGRDMDRNTAGRRPYIESLQQALGTAVDAINGTLRTVTVPGAGKDKDVVDYELPIVEPLSNAVHLAARVVSLAAAPEAFDPSRWRNTRIAALGEMIVAIANANAALNGLAGLDARDPRKPADANIILRQRAVSHLTLRNATEELCEAIIIFLATTELHVGERPEDRIEDALRSTLDLEQIDAFRMDNGEQAGTMAISALRHEAGAAFLIQGQPKGMYFEYPDFVGENAVPFLNLDTRRRNKSAVAAKATVPTASFIDPRPYLTEVDGRRSTSDKKLSARTPIDAMKSELATAVLSIKAEIAKSTPSKGAVPHTLLVDLSNLDYMHPEVLLSIRAAAPEVAKGLMRFVLINSGAKHEQQGHDKFQYGRAIVIGKALEGMRDFDDTSLLDQFLGLMEDLRDDDAEELSAEAEAHWAENFASVVPSYAAFMQAVGQAGEWSRITLAITSASKSTATDRLPLMHTLAEAGHALIESELDKLASAYKGSTVSDAVTAHIALLPRADQESVRLRILRATRKDAGASGASSGGQSYRQLDAPSTRTGIANAGNTCYLSAGLNLLAFSTPYFNLFAPVLGDPQPRAMLRAAVRAVLVQVRAGTLVERAAIRTLLALMDQARMLPRPSANDERHGLTASTAQQDPSEVVFRKLLDLFGTPDVRLEQSEQTIFGVAHMARAADQAGSERYSTVSALNPTVARPAPDGLIELSIAGHATLQAALDAHFGEEALNGVKAVVDGEIRVGPARRRIVPGANGPLAITIALKRWLTVDKDKRAIGVPEWLVIRGVPYRLRTVIHHEGDTPTSGHYTASSHVNGQWQYRDDAYVVAADPDAATRRGTGYMFSFERVDALPVDAAAARIG
ncbi:hypothetical protein FHW83_004225 [Duganella sp. SG902]|uniref:hypothetical protein n=1 Tax=Duganella sp. SG902 TaxID=2587016 RepID=UPI00159E5B1A|nr:hypothetical protein [Duganella sp. SG902]NVM78397.1 hypothetical protein [Duganella sp. SG902]